MPAGALLVAALFPAGCGGLLCRLACASLLSGCVLGFWRAVRNALGRMPCLARTVELIGLLGHLSCRRRVLFDDGVGGMVEGVEPSCFPLEAIGGQGALVSASGEASTCTRLGPIDSAWVVASGVGRQHRWTD